MRLLSVAIAATAYSSLSAASDQQVLYDVPERGAVASESKLCSEIGGDIYRLGGNAVDAAVATTLCVGTVAGHHSGIGGGGFMLVRDKDGKYEAIDFRESAPAASDQDMFKHNVMASIVGGLAVGVPGEVKGLSYAHEKYGKLPWKVVVGEVVEKAQWFPVNRDTENYIRTTVTMLNDNFFVEDESFARDFSVDGQLVAEGDFMRRERYMRTLQILAEKGPEEFYTGEMAAQMVKTVQANGGIMTLDDLKNYTIISRPVLNITYGDYKLFTCGSPAGGAIGLAILQIATPNPEGDKAETLREPTTAHTFVEAMKFAYAGRLQMGDPDFVAGVDALQEKLLSKKYADEVRGRINENHTLPLDDYDPDGIYQAMDHGTSQISTADVDGMAVSLTTTVNLLWGARLMDPELGIIFNNEMNDFSIPGVPNEFGFAPSEANFIAPGKRPLSSITPIIAEHASTSSLFAAIGAAGGSRIISATAQAVWAMTAGKLGVHDAVAEPRLHHQLLPQTLVVEKRFPIAAVRGLKERGHNVTWVVEGLSAVHGVQRIGEGRFMAASDPRQKDSGGVVV